MSLYQMLQESGALGGNYRGDTAAVDAFPALSLLECVTSLPVVLTESAIENEVELTAENMLLAEAAMMNESATFEALNENVFSNMKDRVVKYYNKAIEWVKSIIAKIKQWGDSVRMSGKKMSETYGDKVSKVDLKGFTFTGYKFPDDLSKSVKGGCKIGDIETLIDKTLIGADMNTLKTIGNVSNYQSAMNGGWKTSDKTDSQRVRFEKAIDALKKVESAKQGFKAEVLGEMVGKTITNADEINKVLFKHFRDGQTEKKELKDGSGFSRSSIIDRMKKDSEIDDLRNDYTELESAIGAARDSLVDTIDKVQDVNIPDDATADEREKTNNFISARAEVLRGVDSMYKTAIGAITTVRGALTTALKDRNAQDKKLFVAMLNYKNPSAKNNSFEDDDLDDSDFDL